MKFSFEKRAGGGRDPLTLYLDPPQPGVNHCFNIADWKSILVHTFKATQLGQKIQVVCYAVLSLLKLRQ